MPNTKHGFGGVGVIIVILIILAGGAYLWSQKFTPGKVEDPAPTADISNWKTYKNDKYGFEFKYPAIYFLREGFINDGQFVKVTVPNIPNVTVTIGITVGVYSTDKCNIPVSGPTYDKTIVKNGIQFYTGLSGDRGMGFANETEGYSTIHNDLCYQVNLGMDYTRDSNDTYAQHFDKNKVEEMFDQVFSTFRFVK